MKYNLSFGILAVLLLTAPAWATGKVLPAVSNQGPTVMGGADSNDNIVPFRLNADGTLSTTTQDAFGTIIAGQIVIAASGATDRTQGPNLSIHSCTFQAIQKDGTGNTGIVYAGGSTVTNAAGSNTGFPIKPGGALGPISMSNLNQIYFSADTANDNIAVFCN